MKKVFLKAFVLVTICLGLTCKLSAQNSSKDHLITVDVQKDTYVYSETIPITIKYKNNGTNEWRLRKPDNALSVKVYYGYIGNAEKAFRFTMGKIDSHPGPEGSNIMAFTMPEPEYMVIRAGEEYTLVTYIFCPALTFPGKWILWVEDTIEKLKTETIGFQIIFTKDSVDVLLSSAKDSENDPYVRSSHTKYLREIKTNIPHFEWPYWEDTPEKNKQREALIQKNLKEFEEFWNKEKNSPNTEKVIERINKVCREISESTSPKSCPDILEFRR